MDVKLPESKSNVVYADPVKGDAEHTLTSSEKAWKELGWKPEVTVKKGLERYAEWMSNSQL